MLKAGIDIGSNSIRLLILEKTTDGFERRYFDILSTKLVEGAEVSGLISEAAFRRTLKGLMYFLGKCTAEGLGSPKIVGTSALREALNGAEIRAKLADFLNVEIKILSGEEEAELSFRGATADFGREALLLDIGGGSTDFAWGEENTLRAYSFPIGSLRLKEDDGLLPQFSDYIAGLMEGKETPRLIGSGGTITNLAAIDLGLGAYDPQATHGHILNRSTITAIESQLAALTTEERASVAGLQKERADHILEGIKILHSFMIAATKEELVVSDKDLLYALIAEEDSFS